MWSLYLVLSEIVSSLQLVRLSPATFRDVMRVGCLSSADTTSRSTGNEPLSVVSPRAEHQLHGDVNAVIEPLV